MIFNVTRGVERIYIPLADLNFFWSNREVTSVMKMWRSGRSIIRIANRVQRPPIEVFLLLLDLLEMGYLFKRDSGIFEAETIKPSGLIKTERGSYIALDSPNVEFGWHYDDIPKVYQMWRDMVPLEEIAESFDRLPTEVLLLILDGLESGKLSRRKGSIWGRDWRKDKNEES